MHSTSSLLPKDEPEAGEVLRRQFERDSISLHSGFKVVRAANGRLTIKGKPETRQLEYDKLLVGIRRKANLEGLGLEAANVRVKDGGVDKTLRTSILTSTPPAMLRFRKSTRMPRWPRAFVRGQRP